MQQQKLFFLQSEKLCRMKLQLIVPTLFFLQNTAYLISKVTTYYTYTIQQYYNIQYYIIPTILMSKCQSEQAFLYLSIKLSYTYSI